MLTMAVVVAQDQKEEKDDSITPEGSIYYALSILLGLGLNVSGYKYLKQVIFIAAFFAGGVIAYDISREYFKGESYGEFAQIGAALLFGLLAASLAIYCFKLGIFLLGVAGGIVLGQFITTAFIYTITENDTEQVMWITVAVCALGCGLLTLVFDRPIIIVLSAWLGAVICIRGIGYFVGGYPTPEQLIDQTQADSHADVPENWWYYFFATIAMFVFGTITQFRRTSSPTYDRDGDPFYA